MEKLKAGDLVEIIGFVYDMFGDVCNPYKMGTKGIVFDISVNSFGEEIYRVGPRGTDHYYLRKELRKCGLAETEEA